MCEIIEAFQVQEVVHALILFMNISDLLILSRLVLAIGWFVYNLEVHFVKLLLILMDSMRKTERFICALREFSPKKEKLFLKRGII